MIYLYWLPNDKTNYSEYISEIEHFSNEVKLATDVKFEYIDYNRLWQYWTDKVNNNKINFHIENLNKRYLI